VHTRCSRPAAAFVPPNQFQRPARSLQSPAYLWISGIRIPEEDGNHIANHEIDRSDLLARRIGKLVHDNPITLLANVRFYKNSHELIGGRVDYLRRKVAML
jgi:hypothetical protein